MRTVKIIEYQVPDPESIRTVQKRKYRVFLGNYTRIEFDSRKSVEKFLNQLSNELTIVLIGLNDCLGRAHFQYRKAWPYLYHPNARTKKNQIVDIDSKCRSQLTATDKALTLAHSRSSWQNGNAFTWSHLGNAITSLSTVFDSLAEFYKMRSMSADRSSCLIESSNLHRIQKHLDELGTGATLIDKKESAVVFRMSAG